MVKRRARCECTASLSAQLTTKHNLLNQGFGMEVEVENLFDQASGSGRNMAIIVQPEYHHT